MLRWTLMFCAVAMAVVSSASYAEQYKAEDSLVERLMRADSYFIGTVRWGAVAAEGYGRAQLFNYEIVASDQKHAFVCSEQALEVGARALFVLKKHERPLRAGCKSDSAYIPYGRFDTFIYPIVPNLDRTEDWVTIPPATRETYGCDVTERSLVYELQKPSGSSPDDRGPLPSVGSDFFLWQDVAKCLVRGKKP